MLIALCGGICAGKQSIANYLIKTHGFSQLEVTVSGRPQFDENAIPSDTAPAPSPAPRPASPAAAHSFTTVDELVDFVLPRWQENWVTTSIMDNVAIEKLMIRPFFLLINVEAPTILRWRRFTDRCWRRQTEPPDLENFILLDDTSNYGPQISVASLTERAHLRLFNSSSSIHDLNASLDSVDLLNEQRLRPNWDQYFMQLASLAAQRSNCMKRRVGCVLVKDNRVMSTGYNGTPRRSKNCNEGGCPRCNAGQGSGSVLSTCLCLHAEENALLEAGRERIGERSILYCNTCPCLTCSVKIAQLGISEVVYSQGYYMDQDTAAILKEANVKLRQFSPPCNRFIELQRLGGTKVTINTPQTPAEL